MQEEGNTPQEQIDVRVPSSREQMVCTCMEAIGYRMNTMNRGENIDTEIHLKMEHPEQYDRVRAEKMVELFRRLEAIDQKVTVYFLKWDCLIGLIGAICIALSFFALRAGMQPLFVVLLLLGIFGCTITLYLPAVFTRMGREKYAREEPAILRELETTLGLQEGALTA